MFKWLVQGYAAKLELRSSDQLIQYWVNFLETVSHCVCSQGWAQACDPLTSAFWMLGSQAGTTTFASEHFLFVCFVQSLCL